MDVLVHPLRARRSSKRKGLGYSEIMDGREQYRPRAVRLNDTDGGLSTAL
jgi:hypothetical protein